MCGEISKRDYQRSYLRSLGIADERLLERGSAALDEDADDVAFFDRTAETLYELKRRRYALGIITDTYHSKETKLQWLRRNGTDALWDVFVSSRDTGVRKPDPRIYHAALERAGLEPREAAFVGHKAVELDGARAVGMTTVAFNHEGGIQADHRIQAFADLLELFPERKRGTG
jgi:FMN phosphatase YigB (HAD superfamily)